MVSRIPLYCEVTDIALIDHFWQLTSVKRSPMVKRVSVMLCSLNEAFVVTNTLVQYTLYNIKLYFTQITYSEHVSLHV